MKRVHAGCFLATFLCLLLAQVARADEYRTGRVSDVRGQLAVRGVDEDDVSYLEVNAVVREGDTLWTDRDSLAEIELERGTWVRLAEDSKIEIRRLDPSPELRLWTGSAYLDVSDRVDTPVRLLTPVGDLEIERNSVVRVDLGRSDNGRVSILHGRVRVTPDTGAPLTLETGARIYLDDGREPEPPSRFDHEELDSFDRYHRERVDYYINRPVPRELDEDILGARELNDYGSWVEVEDTRYWRPRCGPDWRPYSDGYWSYTSGCGYTWIDSAPWGYTTCHYGRWLYRPVYGWLWYPGYAWAPSYVYWSTFGDYCGWAPLDPWNRPCYYGPGNFTSFNLVIDFHSWSFCHQDNFYYGRHHKGNWGHGDKLIVKGDELHGSHRWSDFKAVKDPHTEFGIPKKMARGLVANKFGKPARDTALHVEQNLPERRLRQIENRFHVPATRDRETAQRSTGLEQLQRDPKAKIDPSRIARGNEALQRMGRQARTPAAGTGAGESGPVSRSPGGFRPPVERDGGRGSGPGIPQRPDASRETGTGRFGSPDRDHDFRRGLPGANPDRGPGLKSPGDRPSDGRFGRPGLPERGADPTPARPVDPDRRGTGSTDNLRDRTFRREPDGRFGGGARSGGPGGDRPTYRDYPAPRGSGDPGGSGKKDGEFRRGPSQPDGSGFGTPPSRPSYSGPSERREEPRSPYSGGSRPSVPSDDRRPSYRDYSGGGYGRTSPDTGRFGGPPRDSRPPGGGSYSPPPPSPSRAPDRPSYGGSSGRSYGGPSGGDHSYGGRGGSESRGGGSSDHGSRSSGSDDRGSSSSGSGGGSRWRR